MKQTPPNGTAEQHVRDIRRKTRKQYSTEEKIRIVISGLRGEHSIAELCRREGIAESLYYVWSKEFMEAGKKRLAGDTERQASSGEVKDLRREMGALKFSISDNGVGRYLRHATCLLRSRDAPTDKRSGPDHAVYCRAIDAKALRRRFGCKPNVRGS